MNGCALDLIAASGLHLCNLPDIHMYLRLISTKIFLGIFSMPSLLSARFFLCLSLLRLGHLLHISYYLCKAVGSELWLADLGHPKASEELGHVL